MAPLPPSPKCLILLQNRLNQRGRWHSLCLERVAIFPCPSLWCATVMRLVLQQVVQCVVVDRPRGSWPSQPSRTSFYRRRQILQRFQSLGGRGVGSNFLGRPAQSPAGPELCYPSELFGDVKKPRKMGTSWQFADRVVPETPVKWALLAI